MAAKQVAPLLRTNIGIVGAMNAGKSTLMNLLTQSSTSIVDAQPGTTADSKIAMMELHRVGPVKLMDTPGIDEVGGLGLKKRQRALLALRESDLAVIIVDPSNDTSIEVARQLYAESPHQKVILYNLRDKSDIPDNTVFEIMEKRIGAGPEVPTLAVNLHSPAAFPRVVEFLSTKIKPRETNVSLLPPHLNLGREDRVFLNIPMDAETPSGRLLRPQAMLQESLLRDYVSTFSYRMDLIAARKGDSVEQTRFESAINALSAEGRLKLLVTDSQAIDVVAQWTSGMSSAPPITTFSVMMSNYMSGGRLPLFVEGLRALDNLPYGARVLICEACNHDRIQDDIGTVQIPAALRRKFMEKNIQIDHAFGREYQTKNLSDYNLLLHCGGCMLDQQKMSARLEDLAAAGVPVTNYGLVLSYFHSPDTVRRVLEPWAPN